MLPTDTDFTFKFDTVLCPASGDQGDCGGGIGDADLDRQGNGNDVCPSAFDPDQALSATTGTSGAIGAACLCGDTSVNPGLISIPDAQIIAFTALGFPTGGQTASLALGDITRTGSLSIGDAQQTAFAALGFPPFTSKCDLNCPAAPKTTDNTAVATFVYERAGCN